MDELLAARMLEEAERLDGRPMKPEGNEHTDWTFIATVRLLDKLATIVLNGGVLMFAFRAAELDCRTAILWHECTMRDDMIPRRPPAQAHRGLCFVRVLAVFLASELPFVSCARRNRM